MKHLLTLSGWRDGHSDMRRLAQPGARRAVLQRMGRVALLCFGCGPICGVAAHAGVNGTRAPSAGSSNALECVLPGVDAVAVTRLNGLSAQLGAITLPGLAPDVSSQLWMGTPLAMRAFAVRTADAAGDESVVARLSKAQPLLRDLAITRDGFMLVGRDQDTQWMASWQVSDGWARGWLSGLVFRLSGSSGMRTELRSVVPSWPSPEARLIAHYVQYMDRATPQSQGVWQMMLPAGQAARAVRRELARAGWIAQSPVEDRWRLGVCVLDFQVLDIRAIGSQGDAAAAAYSYLWTLLRRAPT